MFENRVLRRIFGPRKDEVTVEWRRLHKEEPCGLFFSPNVVLGGETSGKGSDSDNIL